MIDGKRKAIHKKWVDLKSFKEKIARYRGSPEEVEELVENEISRFEQIIDPSIRGEIPPAPQMDALFTSEKNEKKYKILYPAPHEAGLFLLPYTDSFRERFITVLKEEIQPLQTIMKMLRELERLYLNAERACRNDKAEQSKEKKKEPITNRYKQDYDFFKLLFTLTIDNNQLGELLSEVGKLAMEGSVPPGGIVEALGLVGKSGTGSKELTRSLRQYERMASLCENIYVCSIASWPSLSNYVSMTVKAIERKLVPPDDPSIFRLDFIQFQELMASLISGLNGAPTAMQMKALFYAYLSFGAFLRDGWRPKDTFRLNNFSQVGAGKTYTTPIFLRLFSHLIGGQAVRKGKPRPKRITLYFTEANLCQNVVQSMIDIGVSRETLHISQMKTLPTLPLKDGDCVVISRHELGLKEKWQIVQPLDILVRRGFGFIIVADESSFLKNSESGISTAMDLLYTHLKKRHALWIDYRLSATPVNNDTGDFIYLLNTNSVNIAAFLHRYPVIAERMNQALQLYQGEAMTGRPISLDQLLTLLAYGGARTGILVFGKILDEGGDKDKENKQGESKRRNRALYYTDCAGAVLVLFYYAVYRLGLFDISIDVEEAEEVGLQEIVNHLGVGCFQVTQPTSDPVQAIIGLKQPIDHPGSRRLSCLIPCLLLVNEMTSAITYDRALNAESDVHFQINAKQLKANLLESVTMLEVLEKIRQFLNLVMFANLVRKARANQTGWWLLRTDIEQEFSKLRLEFAVAYGAVRGLAVVHKQEEVTRKVHQGFSVANKTDYFPYLAIAPSERERLLGILKEQAGEGILGPRLFDDLAQYFTPVRFFELAELLECPTDGVTLRERDRLREDIEKKRTTIIEILSDALGFPTRVETGDRLTRNFAKDLGGVKPEADGLIHFRPSILARYPAFLQAVHDMIHGAIGCRTEYERSELWRLQNDIGSASVDSQLPEYGVIFKASETLNFPLVLRFGDQVLSRLCALLAKINIKLLIGPGDGDRLRRVIARAASFENFSVGMAQMARRHEVPLLIACHYRVSQNSVVAVTDAEYAINGTVKKEERYRILEAFDGLGEKMGRVLVVTTKAILKGFNIFNAQYGYMSEGMNNAEERIQMAGRLRPLYPQHLEEIDACIKEIQKATPQAPVLRHLSRLKQQVKVFDVVSAELLGGFPDIQAGKALMLNTFLFQQIHQRSFPELFPDEEVLHYVDSELVFNSKTVERFCENAVEESMAWLKGRVEGKTELSVADLVAMLEGEIRARAKENIALSSYFPILGTFNE